MSAKTPPPVPHPWPRLTESLAGERRPDRCQSCAASAGLQVWREHDDDDSAAEAFVILCGPCAERLVEPHPRLYSREPDNWPRPGLMAPLCVDCVHRSGLDCGSRLAKLNGGPGMSISFPRPVVGTIDFRDNRGRRRGERLRSYPAPAVDCEGRSARSGEVRALVRELAGTLDAGRA